MLEKIYYHDAFMKYKKARKDLGHKACGLSFNEMMKEFLQ